MKKRDYRRTTPRDIGSGIASTYDKSGKCCKYRFEATITFDRKASLGAIRQYLTSNMPGDVLFSKVEHVMESPMVLKIAVGKLKKL